MPRRALLLAALTLSLAILNVGTAAAAAPNAGNAGLDNEGPTATTAKVRARIFAFGDENASVTYYFKYGTSSSSLTSTTEPKTESRPDGDWDVRATLTGLSPETKYYVRLFVQNSAGESDESNQTGEFTTGDADADGDGVPDKSDVCPNAAGPQNEGQGCPDSDGDGVYDNIDACPTEPRSPFDPDGFRGCPDVRGVPSVRTDPASKIANDRFTANATVNPRGNRVLVTLQWDISPRFDSQKALRNGPIARGVCGGTGGPPARDTNGKSVHSDVPLPGQSCKAQAPYDAAPFAQPGGDEPDFPACGWDRVYVRASLEYTPAGAEDSQTIVGAPVEVTRPPGGLPTCPRSTSSPGGSSGGAKGGVVRALKKALAVAGRTARIRAILRAGGFSARLTAPSAGKAKIVWTATPRATASAKRKRVVVARGSKTVSRAGKVKVKVKLTKAGRKLLKRSKKVKVLVRGSFKPKSGRTVTAKRSVTLKR